MNKMDKIVQNELMLGIFTDLELKIINNSLLDTRSKVNDYLRLYIDGILEKISELIIKEDEL